jgi:hypothetical protein
MYICDRPGLTARVFRVRGGAPKPNALAAFSGPAARAGATMRTTSAASVRRAFTVVYSCRRVRVAASRRRGPIGPPSVYWCFRCWRHPEPRWLRQRNRSDLYRRRTRTRYRLAAVPRSASPLRGKSCFPLPARGFSNGAADRSKNPNLPRRRKNRLRPKRRKPRPPRRKPPSRRKPNLSSNRLKRTFP